MTHKEAIQKSRDGVAERTDSKGQRWAVWNGADKFEGFIYKEDGSMLPLKESSAELLKDWTSKDPKENVKRLWP